MNTGIATLRKRWLALAAALALVAVALTAGALFAANERQQPEFPATSQQSVREATNPGLSTGLPVPPPALAEPPRGEPGSDVNQVVPGTGSSDALEQWLDEQPDKMGFITREDALTADADTMDWLLYQAVYKDVLTQAEADAIRAWFDRRPSTAEAPELLQYQPTHLDTPDGRDPHIGLLKETEAR